MKELDLQDKYLVNFLTERPDGLRYKEVKANSMIKRNYSQIKQDVQDIINFEMERILNDSRLRHLVRVISHAAMRISIKLLFKHLFFV